MAAEMAARLQRELLIVSTLERLLTGEVARIDRERQRREAQEWDAGEVVIQADLEIASVKALQEKLEAVHQELLGELRAAEGETDGAGASDILTG
ncbi:MAG: hypothetical protein HY329_24815 [Chloroflexi bacterium]|nr:hypothetical protein [Chloroflexota bacterium]